MTKSVRRLEGSIFGDTATYIGLIFLHKKKQRKYYWKGLPTKEKHIRVIADLTNKLPAEAQGRSWKKPDIRDNFEREGLRNSPSPWNKNCYIDTESAFPLHSEISKELICQVFDEEPVKLVDIIFQGDMLISFDHHEHSRTYTPRKAGFYRVKFQAIRENEKAAEAWLCSDNYNSSGDTFQGKGDWCKVRKETLRYPPIQISQSGIRSKRTLLSKRARRKTEKANKNQSASTGDKVGQA